MSRSRGRAFVFLDRDGTLVPDTGYVHRLEHCVLLPGASEGLRRLQDAGFGLAIVTNQSGIGRGLYGEPEFRTFQSRLASLLAADGVRIERTYHCPHAPKEGCACRKPAPGLLLRARDELGADLGRSWMVGDAACDLETARAAGCGGAIRIAPPVAEPLAGETHRALDLVGAAGIVLATATKGSPA